MILVILYISAGIYLLLMSTGLIQKKYMATMDRHRRLGMIILGVGLIILGLYTIYYYRGSR